MGENAHASGDLLERYALGRAIGDLLRDVRETPEQLVARDAVVKGDQVLGRRSRDLHRETRRTCPAKGSAPAALSSARVFALPHLYDDGACLRDLAVFEHVSPADLEDVRPAQGKPSRRERRRVGGRRHGLGA